jgi:hypothetical protein
MFKNPLGESQEFLTYMILWNLMIILDSSSVEKKKSQLYLLSSTLFNSNMKGGYVNIKFWISEMFPCTKLTNTMPVFHSFLQIFSVFKNKFWNLQLLCTILFMQSKSSIVFTWNFRGLFLFSFNSGGSFALLLSSWSSQINNFKI